MLRKFVKPLMITGAAILLQTAGWLANVGHAGMILADPAPVALSTLSHY